MYARIAYSNGAKGDTKICRYIRENCVYVYEKKGGIFHNFSPQYREFSRLWQLLFVFQERNENAKTTISALVKVDH